MRGCLGLTLVAPLLSGAPDAAEVQRLALAHEGRAYRLEGSFVLDVPADAAWRVLTDYEGLPALNPSIEKAKILATDGPMRHRLYVRVRLCAYIFCKTLDHVQWMTQYPSGRLEAVIDPADSDFEHGAARWELTPAGAGSRLDLSVEVRPRFWVPPLVGPWLIREALRVQAQRTADGIERRAAELAR